jgi:hypothetical protein
MTYIEWLAKQGYKKSEEKQKGGVEFWSRPSAYGVNKCKDTGSAIEIGITRDPRLADKLGVFSMSISGYNGNYWMVTTASDLTEEQLLKKGRDIEMRLVDSWRGFN